jgi:HSP20 family protein
MAIERWSPLGEMSTLQARIDRLFDQLGDFGSGGEVSTFRLPIDVAETDNSYLIKAPVPGFKPEEVEVTVTGDVLSVNAKHSEEKTTEQNNYLRREMAVGNMQRQIVLPADARSENINARFENGVLTVEVPRTPKPQPKRIEVRAEGQKEGKQMSSAA